MAIYNKPHINQKLISINKSRKYGNWKHMKASDFEVPQQSIVSLSIMDCCEFLKKLPDESVQLICLDPPYNLALAGWDCYNNYIEWAAQWIDEAYRVLSKTGSLVIFGGIQFRDVKTGDIIDIIHYIRHNTRFKLVNTIIWRYRNGMSAHRFFANRHEEAIWLVKSNDYYFDLDSVRVPYSEKDLKIALKDRRLNPETTRKGKNPTNVWEIGRLNGNSKERVGHPTQKPVKIIERFVKALSYPGAIVLDCFAGSGTVGRVCISEGRHCLMCDSDVSLKDYFSKHIEQLEKKVSYQLVETPDEFFSILSNSKEGE